MCALNWTTNDNYDHDLQRETNFDVDYLDIFVEISLPKLVPDQHIVCGSILQAVRNQRILLYFLDAPWGAGKTFLILLIFTNIWSDNKNAPAIASSGMVAILLDVGQTMHLALKLPLNLQTIKMLTCNIIKNSEIGRVLQASELII